jgi:hypothetical protein
MNVPQLQVILMVMQMQWSNKHGIAQFSMFRATQEATGCRRWAKLGNYSLLIALAAARVTANETRMKKCMVISQLT